MDALVVRPGATALASDTVGLSERQHRTLHVAHVSSCGACIPFIGTVLPWVYVCLYIRIWKWVPNWGVKRQPKCETGMFSFLCIVLPSWGPLHDPIPRL